MNVLSLYTGIGGLDLGLEQAGMTVVGQVEQDPTRRAVLRRHWPHVPHHDTVETAPAWWRTQPRPPVHVITGGIPCQPFSLAGQRGGTDDRRWGWPAMATVVRDLGPRYVLVENVPALTADSDAFGQILADLAAARMDAQWTVFPACAVGAPHTRERLFIVAHAHGQSRYARMGQSDPWALPRVNPGRGGWRTGLDGAMAAARRVDRVSDGVARRMVEAGGDAVVVQVAHHIGRCLVAADLRDHP